MKIDEIGRKYPVLKGAIERIKQVDRIEDLFPSQEAAIASGFLDGKNLVLATPTCSGKTLCAELAMLKTILEKRKKAIYLVPLKALASEKYKEFKGKYEPLGVKVALSIGDYDEADEWLSNFDIIIMSNEKCDSLLRHSSPWFMDVGIIVVDEIHMLNDPERGPTLEVSLTKLMKINPAQVLGLSATIKNHKELADWLQAEGVKSVYRPVRLHKGICFDGEISYNSGLKVKIKSNDYILSVVDNVLSKGKQALVFVNTRRGAESAAEKIGEHIRRMLNPGELDKLSGVSQDVLESLEHHTKQCEKIAECIRKGTAFHHAGLAAKQRRIIEDCFMSGLIKVITATPTLCLGAEATIWNGMSDKKPFENIRNVFALSGNTISETRIEMVNEMPSPEKMTRINTMCGNEIEVTSRHQMLLKKAGKRMLVPAGECKAGDKIATAGRLRLRNTTENRWSDFVKENALPFTDKELDEGMYYLIGAFMGDGYSGAESDGCKVRYKGSPCIVGNDLDIFGKIESACNKNGIYYRESKNSYGTPQIVLTKARWFREFLLRCGVENGINKHIPVSLMEAPENKLRMLLQGLFDTDGYVEKRGAVGFDNTSYILIECIRKSLLRFGIVCWSRERRSGKMKIYAKTYKTKKSKELLINNAHFLREFEQRIGFGVKRKMNILESVVERQYHLHSVHCANCNYNLHVDMFGGRTKLQKEWGKEKEKIISAIASKGDIKSRELASLLGFEPKKNDRRLNHHYELIAKRKYGSNEWLWYLNKLGYWVYGNILQEKKDMKKFFENVDNCPMCSNPLLKQRRGTWKLNFTEGDIYWDTIKAIEYVESKSPAVYDIVLPNSGTHDHLFVADGFIVHNSFGLNLPSNTVIIRDLKRFSSFRGMDYLSNLEVEQMCGRAGRIKYDSEGFAILLPKNESEAKYAWDNYIKGEPEKIYSKLGVEPVLRTHVLALIASGMCATRKDLMDFFFGTFYAHQYKDMGALEGIIDKVLAMLADFGFIEGSIAAEKRKHDSPFKLASELKSGSDDILKPTLIGRRVSELYIDPLTANHIIRHIRRAKRADSGETADAVGFFPLLHLLCNSIEMKPLASVKKAESEEIESFAASEERSLLMDTPNSCSWEYEEFLRSIKTAMIFSDWAEELGEDSIMEKRGVSPGELHARLERMDWMLYSAQELALLLGSKELLNPIKKARIRVKNGVKEELLPLIRLKGVGRVRARKLWSSGIKSISSLRDAPLPALERILGEKTAAEVREQLGPKEPDEGEQETLEVQ